MTTTRNTWGVAIAMTAIAAACASSSAGGTQGAQASSGAAASSGGSAAAGTGATTAQTSMPTPGEGVSSQSSAAGAPDPSSAATVGATAEAPVMRCGPRDSYHYVASVFRCQNGTNPLGGDPRAGAAARRGNVGANSTGHIIDLYVVPCPEGPREVYVDMYGCGAMQQQLDGWRGGPAPTRPSGGSDL